MAQSYRGSCGGGWPRAAAAAAPTCASWTSNCDAKAQCGPNAPVGEEDCPLNVCCSQFGFCGTTEDSCGDDTTNETYRIFRGTSYWFSYSRELALKFGSDGWGSFMHGLVNFQPKLIEMTPCDSKLLSETTALKSKNLSLKVFLSIGGWTFNDPPTQGIFSILAASGSNINTFIKNVLNVIGSYGFDGININWEYPIAEDRRGSNGDKANYVTLLKAIKSAFSPHNYSLNRSFTSRAHDHRYRSRSHRHRAPGTSRVFVTRQPITLGRSYSASFSQISPEIYWILNAAHTNLTEIETACQLYANVGVDPSRPVMGISFYGRSFHIVFSPVPNRPVRARQIPLILRSGMLMFSEIGTLVNSNGTGQLIFDEKDAVRMIIALWGDVTANNASSSVTGDEWFYTGCGLNFPDDYTSIGKFQQNPKTLQTCKGLDSSQICCPVGVSPQSCTWRGKNPSGICNPSCLEGEFLRGLSQSGDRTGSLIVGRVPLLPVACLIGEVALCCKTNEDVEDFCFCTNCGDTTPTPLIPARRHGAANPILAVSKSNRKLIRHVYPSLVNSLIGPRIAQTNWAGTLSADFLNSWLNKWLMWCFGGYGTVDACNHDQAMLNSGFIKVRAVSGLTLLAALKSSLCTA
ncbi:glycoside hydrolase superfamily [Mycena sanguinolenta]|nr:glycoside hydrolase superfamily [Mycena sanguinolenta]